MRCGYRCNDKIGFFDLKVEYSGNSSRGSTGMSPFEVMDVKILEPSQEKSTEER